MSKHTTCRHDRSTTTSASPSRRTSTSRSQPWLSATGSSTKQVGASRSSSAPRAATAPCRSEPDNKPLPPPTSYPTTSARPSPRSTHLTVRANLPEGEGANVQQRSAGEAVRVAGRVAALEPGLVDAMAAEVVAVREESDIGDKTARGGVGVELCHPCPNAVGI
jgi:hypothetical protein